MYIPPTSNHLKFPSDFLGLQLHFQAITEAEAQALDLDACAARAGQRFDPAAFGEYAAKLRRSEQMGGGCGKKMQVSGTKMGYVQMF